MDITIIPYNLNLAQRDLLINQINKQIKAKRELLVKKSKQLEKKQEINEFLGDVKNDYNKYYNYIIKEKMKQYEAMNMLNTYLEDLIHSEKLVSNQLKMAKIDQRQILEEMNKIKGELDEIVSL
jgi:cell division septum initiation protein DivIVA